MKKEWIARELMMEIVVGAFLVLILVGMGMFTIVLSRSAWFSKKYALEVVFGNVNGLRTEDNVVVRGMPVGKIKSLSLRPDGVHVIATLEHPIRPRPGYQIRVVTTSMLGGRYMEIEEGPADLAPLPEDTLFKGRPSPDLMGDAAEVIAEVKNGLVAGGIVSNLQASVSDLREIMARANAGKGTLGRLLSEDDSIYTNLAATAVSLKNISDRLDRGEGTLGRLLSGDDSVYTNLAASALSLKNITERVNRGEGTLGRLLSKDDRMYTDMSDTVAALKRISYRIDNGEGTVGRLMKDDALYLDVKNAVQEMRAAIDDVRENTPVVTFTTILFSAF